MSSVLLGNLCTASQSRSSWHRVGFILISIYYIAIGVIFAYMNGVPMLAKIIALVVPALLSGVAITVIIQRIKEIKKGEDDDLSKY